MLLQITAVLLIVTLLAGIFVACGEWLYCKAVSEGSAHPVSFRTGTGFFLGMALFEALWKLMAYASGNAKMTLAVTVLLMTVITLIKVKSLLPVLTAYFSSIDTRRIVKIVLVIFLAVSVYVLEIFLNTDPFPFEEFADVTNLGSLHSGRYANIATFISESNRIPVLNQNYGQSMLAAVSLIMGFNSPFLTLNLWLSTSVVFMCLAFYGFFIMLGLNNLMSLAGSFLLMIGNTALSLFPILVIDSGNPFFLTGYTDTLFSVGSFLGFLVLLKNFYENRIKSALYFSITAAVLCVSWSFSAAHNIVLSAILVSIISGVMLVRKKLPLKHKLLFALMVIFVLAGITQGGMLTPRPLCDNAKIPGALSLPVLKPGYYKSNKTFDKWFMFPYMHLYGGKKRHFGMFYNKREIYQPLEEYKESAGIPTKYFTEDTYNERYYRIEADFFNSLRITFFPLLGLILPWCISGFRETSLADELADIKKLWFAAFVLFLSGYLIAFCFQLLLFKWEFSRFLIPGYATAIISFVASLNIILRKISQRKSWLVIFGVMFVMSFGQILLVVSQIRRNVFESKNSSLLPFYERFNMLVYFSGSGTPED